MDLTGDTYGRLTVIGKGEARNAWRCRCQCGSEKTALSSNLRSGKTQSCGCLQRERATRHGASGTLTYKSWRSMIGRCTNPADPSFQKYGGAGVTVAPEWLDYHRFVADMGERPANTSIDRIDPFGGYHKANCRWATAEVQMRNRRIKGPLIDTPKGLMTICEAADASGIPANTLRQRRRLGWTSSTLFDPINRCFSHPKR